MPHGPRRRWSVILEVRQDHCIVAVVRTDYAANGRVQNRDMEVRKWFDGEDMHVRAAQCVCDWTRVALQLSDSPLAY
jgi:hypothetical protein